jgi:NAD(P)-dependent dehydrogenase (short-subunit alcohol dehydrogenase family)
VSIRYNDFAEAVVIITGAAAGIGRATALAFARQGARVVALDRDTAGLDTLVRIEIEGQIIPQVTDVRDGDALSALIDRICTDYGAPRVIVNNAGVDDRRPFLEMEPDDWRAALAVNIDHHFIVTRRSVPFMRTAGGGAIVNLSSTAFMKMAGNLTSYHAAKAGIIGLTRGLARELGPFGIRVNAIAPGRVVTERVGEHTVTPDWERETKTLQCLPSLIRPDDIADCAMWLASNGARMVTGQTLIVDGGVV